MWSDRGLIYDDPHTKSAISHMKAVKLEYLPPNRLAHKEDDDDKVDYNEMLQYHKRPLTKLYKPRSQESSTASPSRTSGNLWCQSRSPSSLFAEALGTSLRPLA